MRRGWRKSVRWAALAVGCLVFGVVMTWASGWGFAIWDQRKGGAYENADKRELWGSVKEARSSGLLGSAMSVVLSLPTYTRDQSKTGTRCRFIDGTEVWTFGWPRPCLAVTVRGPNIAPRLAASAMSTRRIGMTWDVGGKRVVLPVRVEWDEFRWDVGCWALGLGVALFGWPVGRWVVRRKRGLCVACGYDLRGTPGARVCPECGQAVRALGAATFPR